MPRLLIQLTLEEIQVAIARHVKETVGVEVVPTTLNFQYGETPQMKGRVVGGSFDIMRGGEDAAPEEETHEPAFNLYGNRYLPNPVVSGHRNQILAGISYSTKIYEDASSFMDRARPGDEVELSDVAGKVVYRIHRTY